MMNKIICLFGNGQQNKNYNDKLKINQMFINNRMGKQSLIYAYNRILYFNENGLYTTTNDNMAKSHKHNSELKKINTKEYICMSPFR